MTVLSPDPTPSTVPPASVKPDAAPQRETDCGLSSQCAHCKRPISGKSPDVKVCDLDLGALHLSCAWNVLGRAAFRVPGPYYVPMKARMY